MKIEAFEGFELNSYIQNYVSFEQERCYRDAGQFTLTLNSLEHKDDLQIGNYLIVDNDALIIENVHQYSTGTKELRLEVSGRGLASILDRRVVGRFTAVTAKTYEEQIYSLLQENFIQPKDSRRKVDCLQLAPQRGFIEKPAIEYILENRNCLDIIKELCINGNLGFRMQLFPEEELFLFGLYQGRDLTEDVFFSEEYGNVADSEIYEQTIDFRNAAYTSVNGILTEIEGGASGLFRREMIVSSTEKGGALTELRDRSARSAAECSICLNGEFVYKEDWDIGDTISFIDNSLGFLMEQPILSVKESYTNTLEIEVNFGDTIPTVYEKLERRLNNA